MSTVRVDTQLGRYSQSLERGLAILRCFTGAQPSLGISDVAERLGMTRTTTHRYMSTLVGLGYLEQDSQRKYRLAPHASDLGRAAIASTTLHRHARPHLEELRELTDLTASVAVLDGTETLCLDCAQSFRGGQPEIGAHAGAGQRRRSSHHTAAGKAILGLLGEEAQNAQLLRLTSAHAGSDTAVPDRTLRRELAHAAGRGYATNEDCSTPLRCSIAVPVRDADGTAVGALELSTDSSTVSLASLVQRTRVDLIASANRLSSTLRAGG
jgi:IclR family pca regulon transcriptional regulator